MFIILPLILILASVSGIFFIVWRKLPNLDKFAELNTAVPNGASFSLKNEWRGVLSDLCPEILGWTKGIKFDERFKEYREIWLIEIEKVLRRMRVFSLKMDRFSDSLIKKIRSKTYTNENIIYSTGDGNVSLPSATNSAEAEKNAKEEFKKEEQVLILEIARNPKSALLYEKLGDLYHKAGDYRDAKESYEAAIELSPQNEELKKKLSQALEKLNQSQSSQN